jgi:hypothetical protein
LGARRCPFVLSGEDEIITEQLEFGTVLESAPSRLGFVIDFSKFLSRKKKGKKVRFPEQEKGKKKENWHGHARGHTYHDQRFLHARDDIACEVRVAFGVQHRRELVESRGVNHHV